MNNNNNNYTSLTSPTLNNMNIDRKATSTPQKVTTAPPPSPLPLRLSATPVCQPPEPAQNKWLVEKDSCIQVIKLVPGCLV